MPIAESLGRFRRIGLDETGVAMGQVKGKVMGLELDAINDRPCFAEVNLGMARRMSQRHEHFTGMAFLIADVIRNDCYPALKAMLIAQTLINAFGCMALLLWAVFIVEQYLIDNTDERTKLWTLGWFAALIARRCRMLKDLGNRLAINAKTPRRFAATQTIMMARKPNPPVNVHVIHLPAFRPS